MSKRPTPTEIRDHYRPNVEALDTDNLLRMVRGGDCFAKGAPQYIKKELHIMTTEKNTKWVCPKCPFKLTTLPTPYPPTHRCTKTTKTATTMKADK